MQERPVSLLQMFEDLIVEVKAEDKDIEDYNLAWMINCARQYLSEFDNAFMAEFIRNLIIDKQYVKCAAMLDLINQETEELKQDN